MSQEGKDLHQLGLSKAKSTPQDWIRHAQTMVRCAQAALRTGSVGRAAKGGEVG